MLDIFALSFPKPAYKYCVALTLSLLLLLPCSAKAQDSLRPARDCNGNFRDDLLELRQGERPDCDLNGSPDECALQPIGQSFAESAVEVQSLGNFIPRGAAVFADFNNDGQIDIAAIEATDSETYELVIYLKSNQLEFKVSERHSLAGGTSLLTLRGAGGEDLLAVDTLSGQAAFYRNTGTGHFVANPLISYSNTDRQFPISGEDLTGDGLGDFLFSESNFSSFFPPQTTFSLLENLGNGSFLLKQLPFVDETGGAVPFVANLVGDATKEILFPLAVSPLQTTFGLFAVDASGSFEQIDSIVVQAEYPRIIAADNFQGSGLPDIVFGQINANLVILKDYALGEDKLVEQASIETGCDVPQVIDIENDGDLDLVCTRTVTVSSCCRPVYLRTLLNDGNGRFFFGSLRAFHPGTVVAIDQPLAYTLVDVTGNSLPDVLSVWMTGGTIRVSRSIRVLEQTTSTITPPVAQDTNLNYTLDACEVGGVQFRRFSAWNSYLRQNNILELYNPGASAITLEVSLRDATGGLAERIYLNLNSKQKFDLLLNLFSAFMPNSYGVVEVKGSGQFDGGVIYYRETTSRSSERAGFNTGQFDYVYKLPLVEHAEYGESSFIYNSLQPSAFGGDQDLPVYQWLSIVNLSSQPAAFEVSSNENLSSSVITRAVTIGSFGRADLDGGHGFAVPLGVHRVKAVDPSVPFISVLTRYGTTFDADRFAFAFPVLAAQPSTSSSEVASSGGGAANWFEIANPNAENVAVELHVEQEVNDRFPITGGVTLRPFEQGHIYAPTLIGLNRTRRVGTNSVTPFFGEYLINTISYFYSSKNGAIETAFLTKPYLQANSSTGIFVGYNLFLGMQNWLRLVDSFPSNSVLNLYSNAGAPPSSTFLLSTFTGQPIRELDLHNSAKFSTTPNTYGLIEITPPPGINASGLIGSSSDLLRIRQLPDSSFDFIMRDTAH